MSALVERLHLPHDRYSAARDVAAVLTMVLLIYYCIHPAMYAGDDDLSLLESRRTYVMAGFSVLLIGVWLTPNRLSDKMNRRLSWIWFGVAPFAVYFSLLYLNADKFNIDFFELDKIALVLTFVFLYLVQGILFGLTGSIRFSVMIYAIAIALLGIANCFVISFRGQALSAADLFSVSTAATVASEYTYTLDWYMFMELMLTFGICTVCLKLRGGRMLPLAWRAAMLALFVVIAGGYYYLCCKTDFLEDHDIRSQGFTHQLRYKKFDMLFTTLTTCFYLSVDKPDGYSLTAVEEIGAQYVKTSEENAAADDGDGGAGTANGAADASASGTSASAAEAQVTGGTASGAAASGEESASADGQTGWTYVLEMVREWNADGVSASADDGDNGAGASVSTSDASASATSASAAEAPVTGGTASEAASGEESASADAQTGWAYVLEMVREWNADGASASADDGDNGAGASVSTSDASASAASASAAEASVTGGTASGAGTVTASSGAGSGSGTTTSDSGSDSGSGSAASGASSETGSGQASDSGTAEATQTPDIIVIMNESFADYESIGRGLNLSEDNMPFIHNLTENTIKGTAYSSVFGGNTPNSEYEFLTGNTMGFLPASSVGFNLFVRGDMPSLASQLDSLGYYTLAMHPYRGTNYRRNIVYPQIGFEEYYTRENFLNPSYIRSYISDASLFDRIIQEYEKHKEESDSPFLSYNVTIQNHGGYYTSNTKNLPLDISVLNDSMDVAKATIYVNLIKQTDSAFEELITYFEQAEDPVVVIMFGDHQANLGDSVYNYLIGKEENLTQEELMEKYKIPFIVWANYDIEEETIEKTSLNYLYSIIADRLGLSMTGYQEYLLDLSEKIPVINSIGYWGDNGEFYELDDEDSPYYELINDYNILEYNYIFGGDDRYLELFTLDASEEEAS